MREVHLRLTGRRRLLPRDIFGLNAPVPYSIPHEDPRIEVIGSWVAPGHLRFPGGSVANFFDWRSGRLEVPETGSGASPYRGFMRAAALRSYREHPNGCKAEDFSALAARLGASLVWVANLETSSAEEQAAWAADMLEKNVLPGRIELGNEFFLGLLGDATSMARFPDWPTTIALMREYVDAMRPSLRPDTKIAVQAANSRWRSPLQPGPGPRQKAWEWDEAMTPEPWFHAVTVHPYAEIDQCFGRSSDAGLRGNLDVVLPTLLAKVDSGLKRTLDYTAAKMPGKEIWVTEWGAGEIAATIQGGRPVFNGMWLHVCARQGLALLRLPLVTVISYHAFFFDGGVWAIARPIDSSEGWKPMGSSLLIRWFNLAANGDSTYEGVRAEGAAQVMSRGIAAEESFLDVEGALFRHVDGSSTLLAQNASSEAVRLRFESLNAGQTPDSIEIVSTPDLSVSFARSLPEVSTALPATQCDMEPWSLLRVTWDARNA
ncbi:MAG: hypothetical protein KJ053_09835 [Dehalococcoidia bacterium]|nr:hypothetical protein [Dehalococcoidia bacterium]